MPIPVLKLNLVPPPTPWRQYHNLIGWAVLLSGILALSGVLGATAVAYRRAATAGHNAATFDARTREASQKQASIEAQLQAVDVEKELPRWRLAERILTERSTPWSRLTAELERSLVQDVRIKNIQRTRDNSQKVLLKIKGEARNRASEDAFLEALKKNAYFAGTILEREAEGQGGTLDFDFTLPVSTTLVAYRPLPKFGPARNPARNGISAVTKPATSLRNPSPAQPTPRPSVANGVAARPVQTAPPVQAPPRSEFARPTGPTFRPTPRPMPPRPNPDMRSIVRPDSGSYGARQQPGGQP